MEKLRILVVDDSIVYRKIVSAAVESTGLAVVENSASNGVLAIERLEHNIYDAVLLDINMPEMDGLEALKKIKQRWKNIHAIMVSSASSKDAQVTLEALEAGAMDFIVKPLEEDYQKNMSIVKNHLKVLFTQIRVDRAKNSSRNTLTYSSNILSNTNTVIQTGETKRNQMHITGADILLIASSTGGPVALEKIFNGFGDNFLKPIIIVQHMPPDFTKVLAESLDQKSKMRFIEGYNGGVVRSGQGIVAPGGMHMITERGKTGVNIYLSKDAHVNGVRPSADVTFRSVAKEYAGARILAVVLTGMGNDGTAGVMELKKRCSCYCITQSERSCVVYGMPRNVDEAGLSDESVDLCDISKRIAQVTQWGS